MIIESLKRKIEISKIAKAIERMSAEEKSNINKVINFAITWWLKDLGPNSDNINAQDSTIDDLYSLVKTSPISNDDMIKLEYFKNELGLAILEELLKKEDAMVELYCGYGPEGMLSSCIHKTDCEFLSLRLPIKSKMQITRQTIYLKEGYGQKLKLAFDVNRSYTFPIENKSSVPNITEEEYSQLSEEEKRNRASMIIDEFIERQQSEEFVLPSNFKPSNYNFFSDNCARIFKKNDSQLKKNGRSAR